MTGLPILDSLLRDWGWVWCDLHHRAEPVWSWVDEHDIGMAVLVA